MSVASNSSESDSSVYIDLRAELGNYYFLSLTLSVCMYVRLSVTNIDSSFLIPPIFGRQLSMTKTTKRSSSNFDLGPITLKIYSPKICTKSPISRLVWQIDRRCLGLPQGPTRGGDPCCHNNENWARRGDLVAYRLVFLKYASLQKNVTLCVIRRRGMKCSSIIA